MTTDSLKFELRNTHQRWETQVIKLEDLRLTYLTLIKGSTWLWLGIHNLRLDFDDSQVLAFLSFFLFDAYWEVSFVFDTLLSKIISCLGDFGRRLG